MTQKLLLSNAPILIYHQIPHLAFRLRAHVQKLIGSLYNLWDPLLKALLDDNILVNVLIVMSAYRKLAEKYLV